MSRFRLVGKSKRMQSLIQPISTAIPCKHASCPVSPVGCRGQTHHENLSLGIPEPGDRPSPIFPIPKPFNLFLGNSLTICRQPMADGTIRNSLLEKRDRSHLIEIVPQTGASPNDVIPAYRSLDRSKAPRTRLHHVPLFIPRNYSS